MTDLIVHNRSGSYSFDGDMMECSNEVQRLNPHIYNKQDDNLIEGVDAAGVDGGENP